MVLVGLATPEHISSAMLNPNQLSVGLEKAEGVSLLLLSQFGDAFIILTSSETCSELVLSPFSLQHSAHAHKEKCP